jgi:3-dehydroquinate synthase
MDLVLIGLPGSGKTAAGRRLARRHRAEFVDLDEVIAAAAGCSIAELFEKEGEPGFRARERMAIVALGPPDEAAVLRRVISTGGGAPIDPRNRWHLYRGREVAWLDAPPEILAQRTRRSPTQRPLLAGREPIARMRELAAARARFYAPAGRIDGIVGVAAIVDTLERLLEGPRRVGTTLLRAQTSVGLYEVGEGNAVAGVLAALASLEARRAIAVSEPRAWEVAGRGLVDGLAAAGIPVDRILLPEGEAAKRLAVVEEAARELARLRAERRDPLVAVGGGALGDAAGFVAATWLRGVPVIHVPTTLVAQVDSAIGGKTAVDLPEGKNLVGAFHQPAAIVVDVRFLQTLPARQLRAALGEAVKMAALGDERLFELLETRGRAIASGEPAVHEDGSLAEVVERCGWAKIEVVTADEREQGGRIHLNLGHSLGHAIEAAAAYEGILHGEAVSYGLRAACRIGQAAGVTPPERAARIEALLDTLELGRAPLPYPLPDVLAALGTDKKHAGGRLRWILPTATGVLVSSEVPDEVVEAVAVGVLAGAPAGVASR